MKKFRLLCMTLALALLLMPYVGEQKAFAASASDIKDGDIVTFGSYPQSLVTDSELIKKLEATGKSWEYYPYYAKNTNYSTNSTYPTMWDIEMMKYADFTYNGKKYRGVKILKYRPIDVLKVPDSEYKQQSNGYIKNTVYFFAYEPIHWIVLDKSKGILLSEKVLDAQPFSAYYKIVNNKAMSAFEGGENASASNYYYSTVRHWLNAYKDFDSDYGRMNFLNTAFSTSEKTALSTYSVSVLDGSASRNANDYVFLLPQSAANSYKSRITSSDNTDYAESQGMSKRGAGTGTPWYLATMTDNTNVYYMQDQSIKSSSNSAYFSVITSTQTGIRPAIKVDLSNANVVGPFKISTLPNADTGIPTLLWDLYPGAKSYEVYRCPENSNLSSEASWSKVATLGSGATDYSDPSTKTENTYYYRVRAVLADRAETSNIVHVNCALPRPVISMGNRDNETGLPKVTWKAVEGATEYEIYRREDGSSELKYVTAVTANTASTQTYLDTSGQVEAGKVYYYRIKALSRSSVYDSAYSVEKSIRCTLAAPAPITKDDSSDGMPKLAWPAVSGAYRYLIQYKKSSDTEWKSGLTTSTSYVLPNCEPGATYNYKVIAQYFYPNQQTTPFDSAPNSGSITCAAKPEFTEPAKVHAAFSGRSQVFLKVGSKGKGLEFKWWFKRPLSGSNAYELEFTSGVNVSTNGCTYSLMPYTKDDGAQYYVVVTDKFGRTATSPTSTIVVFTNPKDTKAKIGETAYFSVASQYYGYISSLTYQWEVRKPGMSDWINCDLPGAKTSTLAFKAEAEMNNWEFRCVVSGANISTIYSYGATLTIDTNITDAKAKYSSITKTAVQEFTVTTSSDVKYLMLYAEGGSPLVKSWPAAGNSTVGSDGKRTWNVSQAIGSAGDRKLVFKGGTTNTTPVTNAVTVPFKVENTGVISASVKNATIKKGGEQVFTVKTTSDAKYLVEYAEDGKTKVKTWTADSSNSSVSGNVRTWTVKQNIATAGNRNLIFKAGTTTTPTSAQRTAAFTVEDVWVNSASVKYATIGKSGTQTFTVKTTSTAQNLMLYAEGGNLVKTWPASGNSTVSGDVRTWTVKLAIGTAGNRELTFKAGKTTTPSPFGKSVKFTVTEKKILSAKAKYTAITKASMQGFTVTTTADVKYLMLYAEDGKTLVKSWAASGNSTVAETNIRTWNVIQEIGSTGDRKLVFKGGTTNTTAVTNASTVSFKVVASGVLTASAKNATMNKGTTQTFTVTTTADCNYLAEYAESGNLVTTWTANSSNSKVSGNVRTWTVTQTIGTAGKRTLMFKAGKGSTVTAAERSVSFTVK